VADALISGWQLGGTTRWTSGFPVSVFQGYVWPTNWDEMGWSNLTGAPAASGTTIGNGTLQADGSISGNGILAGVPNIFKNPNCAATNGAPCARAAFDYAYPGQSGKRNAIRGDGYLATDINLSKQWRIPHTESHTFEMRWSVFNVFNNTRFDAFSMQDEWDVQNSFGNYGQTLTNPRRMEFAGIYRF